jgi:anti-sigma regulatory factor (Ser/Thr protein kinase)
VTVTHTPPDETPFAGYRHEAFLYSGTAEFLSGTVSFIRRAVGAGDPVLVMVSGEKIGLLRRQLGADAENVTFADMARVGDNPARIIAAWRAFVQDNAGAAQLWGIGEPIYPERSPTELAECQLHEALLNVAFDVVTPLWLMCPYNLEALAADVIDEAHRTHPFVVRGEERQACGAFRPVDLADPFDRPVPPRPADADHMSFQAGDLRRVRGFVATRAEQAGLDREAADAMVLAVNEVATNSLRHGGGRGQLRAWTDGRSLVFEVSDQGHITSPLVGRLRPALAARGGAGLWLANQLCDLVQIYSSARGSAVRVGHNI